MKYLRTIFLLTALIVCVSPAQSAVPLRHVRITNTGATSLALELEMLGYDVLEGTVTESHLDLIVSSRSFQRLLSEGFTPKLLAVGQPFRDIQARRQSNLDIPTGYPDLSEIMIQLEETAANYPAICQLVDLTAEYGTPRTEENRHMFALKISDNVLLDEDEPAFLLVSNHHAREIVTPVLALHTIEQLVQNYGSDPLITSIVNSNEIWIAPVWNPDGYSYVFETDNMWRKNRHVFPNGVGVDQNRNYPQGWDSPCSGNQDPNSDIFKGFSPASEAETQTMIAWSLDRQFAKVIDFHSSGREVLHGYACWDHPFDSYLEAKAIALANAAGYGGDHRPPSADGEHYQWQLGKMGALAFLVETQTQFQPTYSEALAEAAQVWPGTRWLLQQPIPLSGYITNVSTGEPVTAEITFPSVDFEHQESSPSNSRFGWYHAFFPDGWYNIDVSAENFETHTSDDVFVNEIFPAHLDVAMQPLLTGLDDGSGDLVNLSISTKSSSGTLQYELPTAGQVIIELFDMRGALVSTPVSSFHEAGRYEIPWPRQNNQGQTLASGMYFFRLQTGGSTRGGKLVLVK